MKFSIVGSCVSRDVLEVLKDIEIGPYIGRASIASIVSPASRVRFDDLPVKESTSDWHRRVLRADFDKLHEDQMRSMGNGYVLIDLIEERQAIADLDGAYVTHSQALTAAVPDFKALYGARVIPVFSREGQEHWYRSLPKFAEMVCRHIDLGRIIVHRSLYAGSDAQAESANRLLTQMYDALEALFPGALTVSHSSSKGSPDHKWGCAPYHYVDDYYFSVAERICRHAGIPFKTKPGFTFQKVPA